MKKGKVAVIVQMLFISLIFEVQPFTYANPVTPHPIRPFIIFDSPQNKSYNTDALVLNVSVGTITLGQCPGESYEVTYSLDGQEFVSIPLVYKGIFDGENSMPHSLYIGAINLPSLFEGNHSIVVHCLFEIGETIGGRYVKYSLTGDNRGIFAIDKRSPHIFVQTLENKTYETSDLPLNFTVNEVTSKLTYSLDGQENITITGNTTLSGLSRGDHNLTLFADDEAGNMGASETLFFTIAEPFPTTLIVASIFIVAVVGTGLLVYLKKRKHRGNVC